MGILRTDRVSGLGGANAIKGSVFFGSDDDSNYNENLAITNTSDLDIGAGNYTIEYWFNCDDTTSDGFNTSIALSEYTNTSSNNAFNLYHYNTGFNIFNRTGGGFVTLVSNSGKWTPSKWHHFAWVRSGTGTNENAIYVDGVSIATFTNAVDYTSGQSWLIGANFYTGSNGYGSNPEYGFSGHLSNVRVSNIARYSGAFTPPTAEYTADSNTILLACQSPSNILQEATGKEVTFYKGYLASSPPQASRFTPNSPVGFSTTSDVGSQYGTTFDGFGSFATSTYMVPPGGNTRERNRGRGIFMGGYVPGSYTRSIDTIEIQSTGNAIDFGDTGSTSVGEGASCSSTTRAVQGGGSFVNTMEFVTIANSSNTTDFGDLTVVRRSLNSLSSETRGIWAGGTTNPAMSDVIDFATIATAGNATDFGNLTVGRRNMAPMTSPTRGVFAGGNPGSSPLLDDTIDYITIASAGNATDFGNLITAMREQGGSSSATRGLIAGGFTSPANLNTIEFITIATTGNASDFGDLYEARSLIGGTSNATRGIFAGGSYTNTIQYVTIATTGNAEDFGDLTIAKALYGATSDSHGGIS